MKYFSDRRRTLKRELALALLAWLVYVVETKDAVIVEILVWPIFSYVAAAFGFDAFAKQLQRSEPSESPDGGRSQRSGQRAGGQGELSGSGKPDNPD